MDSLVKIDTMLTMSIRIKSKAQIINNIRSGCGIPQTLERPLANLLSKLITALHYNSHKFRQARLI